MGSGRIIPLLRRASLASSVFRPGAGTCFAFGAVLLVTAFLPTTGRAAPRVPAIATIAPRPSLAVASPLLFDAPYVSIPVDGLVTALAVGRLDADSHLDVVVADDRHARVRVYRGHGNGTFEPPVDFATSTRASSFQLSDLDRDGDLDLVATSEYFPFAFVLLRNGDGTFGPELDVPISTRGVTLVGDANGDGRSDLVVGGAGRIAVYPGNGDGTFGAALQSPIPVGPSRMAVGDLNGDGRLDVAYTEFFPDRVRTALGNGDGTFAAPQTWAEPGSFFSTFRGIAMGDMNRDGFPDLVTANYYASTVSILLGAAGGSFAAPVSYPAPYGANEPALADVDHDGLLDVLVSSEFFREIAILKGVSGGSLNPAGSAQVITPPRFSLGDVDEDGEVDIVAPGGSSFLVSFGHHGGTFGRGVKITSGAGNGIAAAQCNGDGKADLIALGGYSAILMLPRTGPAEFGSPISQYLPFDPRRLEVGDLDGDGITDAVVGADFSGRSVLVLLGSGAPGFEPPVSYDLGAFSGLQGLGDLDRDGDLDILAAVGGSYAVLRNHGDGSFAPPADLHVAAATFLALADLNGDGRSDLLVGSGSYFTLSLYYATPGGAYVPGPVYELLHSALWHATGDLDGDGRLDIVVGGASDHPQLSFLRTRPDGALDPPATFDVGDNPRVIKIADFDLDGALDIASSGNPISILRGDGHGGFAPRQEYGAGFYLDVADFDDDGRPDIAGVVGGSFGSATWLLLNATGPRNAAPDVSEAAASSPVLWPPNHQLAPVTITGVTDADGDPLSIRVIRITQDEDANFVGDGSTCPDAVVLPEGALVRAERAGNGNGRVYAIEFVASDGRGGESEGVVNVCVPHDHGAGSECIDDGQHYDATARCYRRGHHRPEPDGGVQAFDLRVVEATRSRLALEVDLPGELNVEIEVFDVAGARVARTLSTASPRGTHVFEWSSRFERGVYFVRVRSGLVTLTRKVALVD